MVVAFVVEGISRLVHKTPHNDFVRGKFCPIISPPALESIPLITDTRFRLVSCGEFFFKF